MSRPARSLGVFAAYLIVLAAVLMAWPNTVLSAFGLPDTREVWLRVVGVLVLADQVRWTLLWFGVADVAGAAWTGWELSRHGAHSEAPAPPDQ